MKIKLITALAALAFTSGAYAMGDCCKEGAECCKQHKECCKHKHETDSASEHVHR